MCVERIETLFLGLELEPEGQAGEAVGKKCTPDHQPKEAPPTYDVVTHEFSLPVGHTTDGGDCRPLENPTLLLGVPSPYF